jgi:hypothetical protein
MKRRSISTILHGNISEHSHLNTSRRENVKSLQVLHDTCSFLLLLKHMTSQFVMVHCFFLSTYIHTYIRTYIRTYVRTYTRTHIHIHLRKCIRNDSNQMLNICLFLCVQVPQFSLFVLFASCMANFSRRVRILYRRLLTVTKCYCGVRWTIVLLLRLVETETVV